MTISRYATEHTQTQKELYWLITFLWHTGTQINIFMLKRHSNDKTNSLQVTRYVVC